MSEILAFKQQGGIAGSGQGIGEAITQVETGRVAPLAETMEGGAGDQGLVTVERHDR